MDLKHLSDDQLWNESLLSATAVRHSDVHFLFHLVEINHRRLFVRRGYSSLFDYCIRAGKFSPQRAPVFVNAAVALSECPELALKVESGEICLTLINLVMIFVKAEKKLKHIFSAQEKSALFAKVEGMSTRQASSYLCTRSAAPAPTIKERIRPVAENLNEVVCAANDQTVVHIEHLKERWGCNSLGEVLEKMARVCAKKIDQKPRKKPAPVFSRYISPAMEFAVRNTYNHTCAYEDQTSRVRCTEKKYLQIDHIMPVAFGGVTSVENLRLLCPAHNRQHAEDCGLGYRPMPKTATAVAHTL